jgi:hypothetical protein
MAELPSDPLSELELSEEDQGLIGAIYDHYPEDEVLTER